MQFVVSDTDFILAFVFGLESQAIFKSEIIRMRRLNHQLLSLHPWWQ